ncbi:MAG: hypothetical protein JWM66_1469 [Solirubrobacterales bacterium]|nr:hypothetical protein [Solirubrobacterales bacterium]
MPLTPMEHQLLLALFAVDEHDDRRVSELIAGASSPVGTLAMRFGDARTGRPSGGAACAIVVDPDEDRVLDELFALRAELTEAAFLDVWNVRARWAALSRPGCAEALVRLELLVRSPRPSLHRFLLSARTNGDALALVCDGHPIMLVPADLARQIGQIDIRELLLASLPVAPPPPGYTGALAIALADVGAPGIVRPSEDARRAVRRSAGR